MKLNKTATAIALLLTINLTGCNNESSTEPQQVNTPHPSIKPDTKPQPVKPIPETAMDCFNGELYTVGATNDVYMTSSNQFNMHTATTVKNEKYNNQFFLNLSQDNYIDGVEGMKPTISHVDEYVRLTKEGVISTFYRVSRQEVTSTKSPNPTFNFAMHKGEVKKSNSVSTQTVKYNNIDAVKTTIDKSNKRTFIGHESINVNGINYQTCHFTTNTTATVSTASYKHTSHVTDDEFISVDNGLLLKSVVVNDDDKTQKPTTFITTKALINNAQVM